MSQTRTPRLSSHFPVAQFFLDIVPQLNLGFEHHSVTILIMLNDRHASSPSPIIYAHSHGLDN